MQFSKLSVSFIVIKSLSAARRNNFNKRIVLSDWRRRKVLKKLNLFVIREALNWWTGLCNCWHSWLTWEKQTIRNLENEKKWNDGENMA